MFNFFKKNKIKPNINESETEVEEDSLPVINDDHKTKKETFHRSKDELLTNPSFSILIQINKETEEFIVAVDTDDLSDSNSDLVGVFFSTLTSGEANQVVMDALNSFPLNREEQSFMLKVIKQWKLYQNLILNLNKIQKNKIDPTKIFNIRGGNP